MMAVVPLVEETIEFTVHSFGEANAEDLGRLVGGQTEQSHLAGALEYFVDGKIAAEDEVAAVFDLIEGVGTAQVDGSALPFGELRTQHQRPVIQALANGEGVELVGCSLQGHRVSSPQECVVVFAEANALPLEFTLHEDDNAFLWTAGPMALQAAADKL